MDHQKWSLRWGAGAILCALLLRLSVSGFFRPVVDFLAKPNIAAFFVYLETGRVVRFSPSSEPLEVFFYESAMPDFALEALRVTQPPVEEPVIPVFSAADAETVKFKNSAGVKFDAEALITTPLRWNLTGEEQPAVLILHTHATESYTKSKGETYKENSAFRTLDENYNMLSVGAHLAQQLEAGGIRVLHDRSLHDYPSYNGSYSSSRKAIQRQLEENPSICMVLDLHRDASDDLNNQMRTKATVNGKSSAQLMFVVGTGAPEWEENFSLALKMQVQLERLAPGICRSINLRAQRFNQDTLSGALLVEVGAAGNTHEEALTAVEVLAQAILDLSEGTQAPE